MKWSILGAGRIAHRFAKSLENIEDCELYAISCRTQEKANAFQKEHPCTKAYAGFDKIVEDEAIDAVYIATPHPYHYEWIMKCLQAHKAVLVEKPACMNVDEINKVIQCAKENNTLFMEAMKTRFTPLYKEIKKRVKDGEIGDIKYIYASLCNDVPKENIQSNYLGNPRSGGVLTDTGIYPIGWIEDYLKGKYHLKHVYTNIQDDVIYYTRAHMNFSNIHATIECAMDRKKKRETIIQGTKGTIIVDEMHRPTTALINQEKIEIPYVVDDFYGEIKHFVDLYHRGLIESDIMPFSSSLRCQQIMSSIQEGMNWCEETVNLLEDEEKNLTFDKLSKEDIDNIGNLFIKNQEKYERNAAVRIFDEDRNEVVFEYLPNDKSERNFQFMDGKRNLSKATNHSSFHALVRSVVLDEHKEFMHDFPTYCASGGAFPIIVDNKWKYTILTSGLHEGEDHELIVNTLYEYKGMQIPDFPYRLF